MKMEEAYEGIIMSKRVEEFKSVTGRRQVRCMEGERGSLIQEVNVAGERMIRFNIVIIKTQLSHAKVFYSVAGFFFP